MFDRPRLDRHRVTSAAQDRYTQVSHLHNQTTTATTTRPKSLNYTESLITKFVILTSRFGGGPTSESCNQILIISLYTKSNDFLYVIFIQVIYTPSHKRKLMSVCLSVYLLSIFKMFLLQRFLTII